jgi:molybdopterin-containing oxidoreductase family membrane subunit
MPSPKSNTTLLVTVVGFLVTGAIVVANLLTQGHHAFNTNNLGLFWTLPIVTYDIFLLTSTGLAMTACIGLVLGVAEFNAIAKRCLWLALAGLAGGVLSLFLELGHPLRSLYAIPMNFQTSSPLFWKVQAIVAYIVLLLILISRAVRPGWTPEATRGLSIAVMLAALAISMLAGSVFGMMAMRPHWYGGEVPVAFHIESLLGGMAFAIFFTYMAYGFDQHRLPANVRTLFNGKMRLAFLVVISFHAMFVGARAVAGLWSPAEGLEVWQHIARSPLYHIEIWICVALPFVLMLLPGLRESGWAQMLAAFLVAVGLLIARYEFIIGGQLVPQFKGSWAPELLSYTPSLTEWMLLAMAIFLANVINAWGEKQFNLEG